MILLYNDDEKHYQHLTYKDYIDNIFIKQKIEGNNSEHNKRINYISDYFFILIIKNNI